MKPNNLSVVGLLPKKGTVRLLPDPALAQHEAFPTVHVGAAVIDGHDLAIIARTSISAPR
jgi:hypothetical protein